MQFAALAGEQIVVQRLPQERVAEAEAPVVAGHEHLLGDGLAQRRLDRFALEARDVGERRLVERAPDRDRARDLLRRLRQPLDPHQERVTQALRGGAPAVEAGGEQLLGEQRVALAALEQSLEQVARGRVAEDVRQRLARARRGRTARA